MNTYDDIRKKEHLDIRIKVLQLQRGTGSKRAFEMTVEDIDGTRFPFVVWEKCKRGREYDWEEGHWYLLRSAYGAVWPAGKELHGTRKLEIIHEGLGPRKRRAKILVVPDSHLGKRRGGFGANSWSLDCVAGLSAAIDFAVKTEVDAVVHLGDIFHNDAKVGISTQTGAQCWEALSKLGSAQIPFYYINGNHEKRDGRIWMERFEDSGLARPLRSRPQVVNDIVAIYGVSHQKPWSYDRLTFDRPPSDVYSLLCLHQSIAPLTGNSDPDCHARDVVAGCNIDLDAIAVGHLHKLVDTEVDGCLVFCSGATERLGKARDDPFPSVELLHLAENRFEKERIYFNTIPE